MIKKSFQIKGMHCSSCSILIEGELEDIGVRARADYAKARLETEYDETKISETDIVAAVRRAGYAVSK
jgi:copper chaperone CopZ